MPLFEKLRLAARDLVPERLEREPPGEMRSRMVPRVARPVWLYQQWSPSGLGKQLRLAAALHRDEPPRSLVDGGADREQSVVAMDGRLVRSQRGGQGLGGSLLEHDLAATLLAHGVVLVEDARVLGD